MITRLMPVITVIVGLFFALPQAVPDEPQQPAQAAPKADEDSFIRAQRMPGFKNLQRIGLAFHGYHDIFGQFPPAVLYAPDGKTQYSWRVELLPVLKHYVDNIDPEKLHGNINREQYQHLIRDCGYDVNLSWDSPANRAVLESMPEVYRHPADAPNSVASAYYAVVGEGTAFDPKDIHRYDSIRGWPATTLMIVESRSQEPWTKPIDIAYSKSATVPRFGGFTKDGFLTISCDGAVHFISDTVSPQSLRAFLDKNTAAVNIFGIPAQYEE